MSDTYDFDAPERVTVGTLGPSGQRVFFLQIRQSTTLVTVKLEKQQVGALAQHLGELLQDLPRPGELPAEDSLELETFDEPAFIVGAIGVAYDLSLDRVIVMADELVEEGELPGDDVRTAMTREQAGALAIRGTRLVEAGRPPCPLCWLSTRPERTRVSEDERPPRTAALKVPRLSGEQWRSLLERGSLETLGRMPWSSNATFLVMVSDEDVQAPAVYKPEAGERPLRDFPEGLWRREVAAYELSKAGGLEVVPDTITREDGPLGEGSLQRFIDADFNEHYFTIFEAGEHQDALRKLAGFDLLANNADRKGGHLLIDKDSHIWGIDNGLCFHVAPKLRTVMWDFAGQDVPAEILQLAEALVEELPDALVQLLSPREQQALFERAEDLLDEPYFPAPDPDRRAYPWPMV